MTDIQTFFSGRSFAVAGASANRSKFGNQVFRRLIQSGRIVYPLNPNEAEVEAVAAYASLQDCPEIPECLSVVTPPAVSERVIQEAVLLGVKCIWTQPGAEHPDACNHARAAGLVVIDDGRCLLVEIPD